MQSSATRTDPEVEEGAVWPASASNAAGVKCSECHKLFSRPENLTRHIRSAHSRITRHHCPQCDKRFTRSDLLKKHSKTHSASATKSREKPVHQAFPHDSSNDSSSTASVNQRSQRLHSSVRADLFEVPTFDNVSAMPPAKSGFEDQVNNFDFAGQPPAETADNDAYQTYGEGLFDADLTWTFDYIVGNPQSDLTAGFHNLTDIQSHAHRPVGTPTQTSNFISPIDKDNHADWPDGQSRPGSPSQKQIFSYFGLALFLDQSELDHVRQTCLSLPARCIDLNFDAIQGMFQPILVPELLSFCGPGPQLSDVPDLRTVQHFLLLYFSHVYPRFPITHVPSFSSQNCIPELLLVMVLAGSCYSKSNRGRFCHAYVERARMAITLSREKNSDYLKSVDNLHALVLLSLVAIWTGHKEAYRRADADRGVIVSACRRARLLDCRADHNRAPSAPLSYGKAKLISKWNQWIDTERRKRLGLSIYLLDCQFAALLQRQPYISKAETTNTVLPCDSIYWEASSAEAWKILLGTADTPPSFYHLPILNGILLRKEIDEPTHLPKIDDFSRTLYAYVLHTHIFEWRQAVCMLNTTELMDTPVSLVHKKIGPGLLDRKRWLLGALETWADACGKEDKLTVASTGNVSGMLLYHLGHLALNINFSDLHVVAGRSGSYEDVLIAAQSLRNRLSGDATHTIMRHVSQMLRLAFHVVSAGEEQQCSFEVTVCLFTGGLICWSMHHTLQQQELTDCLTTFRNRSSPNATTGFLDSPSENIDEKVALMRHINKVINALRSVHCLGFASIFASVLAKLCSNVR